jgi:7-cyano-7-deazaguanine synthase
MEFSEIKTNKYAVISLSGGMDSSSLLLNLLAQGVDVTALSFDYGQKHKIELERAKELVQYVNANAKTVLGRNINFKPIKHRIIKLKGLSELLNSSLVEGGAEVPEGHYESENMKETVVPNRNKIFSSIIQAVALSISQCYNEDVWIALGIHAGDFSVYPDCRQEFRDADHKAFLEGNWGAERVSYYTPYLLGTKYDILMDGKKHCNFLNLNFDEVYKRTNTSYKPIFWPGKMKLINNIETYPDAQWYADYKSAASVERVEAFLKLGRPDPAKYADENGPVNWDTVVENVKKVLAKNGK